MYDKTIVIEGLRHIEELLSHLLERTSRIETVDDFLLTPTGVDLLDITAIRLMAVGEEVKKIDKRTQGQLLPLYPAIEWKNIMGLRDFIAHAYFRIDAAVVFDTLQHNVRPLLAVVRQMITDLE